MRADLHVHTRASDGALGAKEIIRLAERRGLDAISFTDHDTTAGWEGIGDQVSTKLEILPGIELACAPTLAEGQPKSIDLLGYDFDPHNSKLRAALMRMQQSRWERARGMLQLLQQLGMPLSWLHVQELAAGESIGRPHLAQALVEAGHLHSQNEAFERYLHDGGPAHLPRWRLRPSACIKLIQTAGGVAILAHPGRLEQWEQRIAALLPLGLDGLELVHPQHSENTRALLKRFAQRHDLLLTGGSDFHKIDESGINRLGRYLAPAGSLTAIRKRARRYAD